ncbi:MAG: hypothetical protein QW726_06095 [Fervidicoccaceae archaeon]|jgi:hypothetical protein
MMGAWDRGLDYRVLEEMILGHMSSERSSRRACYDSILLIQLRNGLFISEAVRAYRIFLESGDVRPVILLSRRRSRKYRRVFIPKEVVRCEDLLKIDEKKLVARVKVYCRYVFKVNTFTIRRAFIRYLQENGLEEILDLLKI